MIKRVHFYLKNRENMNIMLLKEEKIKIYFKSRMFNIASKEVIIIFQYNNQSYFHLYIHNQPWNRNPQT